ncbi:hypothetical protein HUW51_00355 (plasmid) [Adhaeribacter swui]|uniref:Uncharacterized protein n=1 Tax=Adhaeribacter swui TaxID=2086471 RepID=A0A7G7G256_9BACT|nr:hypothetical protein [Adhaeribacter swui]QNF31240.1 hypothetical protein HUW51_00355 [Adhaeribacter swui]
MSEESSKVALRNLVVHACTFNNYEPLRTYGVLVKQDQVNTSRIILKYKDQESTCINDPEKIKACLENLLGL